VTGRSRQPGTVGAPVTRPRGSSTRGAGKCHDGDGVGSTPAWDVAKLKAAAVAPALLSYRRSAMVSGRSGGSGFGAARYEVRARIVPGRAVADVARSRVISSGKIGAIHRR